jgi:hypothetical protein
MKGSRNALLLILMAAGVSAAPSDDDMARCAAIPASDSRLSCYDALAHRPAEKAASAVVKAAPPAAAVASAAPAVPASAAPAVTAAAASAVPAEASAAAIAAEPKNFGLTPAQTHTAYVGPKSIEARMSIVSSDQLGQTFIVLDSGQTWTVLDNDGRLRSGDAITIKRAATGSFLMMTPSNHSYRVRRLK